jgi:hypothetical protein
METPTDVLIYFDQIAGEPKRARLLSISSLGFYEVNLHTASGVRRTLLPIQGTILVAPEAEEVPEAGIEIER